MSNHSSSAENAKDADADADRHRYQSGQYAADHPDWHAADGPHKAGEVQALLQEVGWNPRHVLALGSGSGAALHALHDLRATCGCPCTIEGWDIAPPQLTGATAAPGVCFHHGNLLAAASQPRAPRADLVLALDVLEHLEAPVAALHALARLSDRLIVRLPLDLSVWDRIRPHRLRHAQQVYGHKHVFTRRSAHALVSAAGGTVLAAQLVAVPPPRHTLRQRVVQSVRDRLHRTAPGLSADLLGGRSWLAAVQWRAPQ